MDIERELLQGYVAQLLNERELVITLGRVDGIKKGMRFAVLATPIEIRHPKTNEVIGTVNREKVRVEAVEIQDHLSICATYETITTGTLRLPLGLNLDWQRQVPMTLKADDPKAFLPPLKPEESYVEIGDLVEELRPDPSQ